MISFSRRSAEVSPRGRRMRKALALGVATAGTLTATVFAAGPASAGTVNRPLYAYAGLQNTIPRCMDVFGGLTTNGTGVRTYDCNGTAAQQWSLVDSGSTIRNRGKCLDARNGGTANGTPLVLWTCNGTGSQVFIPRFQEYGDAGTLYNPQSGKCVDVPGNAFAPTYLDLYDCNGSPAQFWHVG